VLGIFNYPITISRWPSPKEASKLFYDVCAWHFYRKGIGMSVSHRYLVLIKFH